MDPKSIKAWLFIGAAQLTAAVVTAAGAGSGKLTIDPGISDPNTLQLDVEAAELFKIYYYFLERAWALSGQGDVFADPGQTATFPPDTTAPPPPATATPGAVPGTPPTTTPAPTPAPAPIPALPGKELLTGALNTILGLVPKVAPKAA